MTDNLAFILLAFMFVVMVVVVGIDWSNRFLAEVMERARAERVEGAHYAGVRRETGLAPADEPLDFPDWINDANDAQAMATDTPSMDQGLIDLLPGPTAEAVDRLLHTPEDAA
jgi:hypothetical protein